MRYAIGVGCRRGCPAEAIVGLVRATWNDGVEKDDRGRLVGEGSTPSPITGLFSTVRKADEPGLLAAAEALGLPLHLLEDGILAAASERVLTRSATVTRAIGLPSVAEAAALVGAGPGARLLGPRRARDGATCALAVRDGDRP